MKFYSVTSYRPTAVTQSLKCSFISSGSTNLLLVKGNRVEVYDFCKLDSDESMEIDGDDEVESTNLTLSLVEDIPLNGRIISVQTFRPKDSSQDRIFALTEQNTFVCLDTIKR